MLKSKTTGAKEAHAFIDNAIRDLNKRVPYSLQESGNKMVAKARSDHRFKSNHGQAERSIQSDVDSKEWMLTFYINPDRVTNNGYNYAWGLHDGTGKGYKKSKMSPKVEPKLKSGGIKHDHFMVRAYEGEIKNLKRDIVNQIERAFK